MGYFDSTKNRALWEIELQNLRKLRAERASGKQVVADQAPARQLSGKAPVRMTYQELLKEEAAAARKSPNKERQMAMEALKEKQKEKQKEPVKKEARVHGMA